MKKPLIILVAFAFPSAAHAYDLCRATILHPVHADFDEENVMAAGEVFEAVTQYVLRSNGADYWCSHGGGCLPAHVFVETERVETIRLENCNVDMSRPIRQGDETVYALVPDPDRVSPRDMRIQDTSSRLGELGLYSAAAGNAATLYEDHPASLCGRVIERALRGDRAALRQLEDSPTLGQGGGC